MSEKRAQMPVSTDFQKIIKNIRKILFAVTIIFV